MSTVQRSIYIDEDKWMKLRMRAFLGVDGVASATGIVAAAIDEYLERHPDPEATVSPLRGEKIDPLTRIVLDGSVSVDHARQLRESVHVNAVAEGSGPSQRGVKPPLSTNQILARVNRGKDK